MSEQERIVEVAREWYGRDGRKWRHVVKEIDGEYHTVIQRGNGYEYVDHERR